MGTESSPYGLSVSLTLITPLVKPLEESLHRKATPSLVPEFAQRVNLVQLQTPGRSSGATGSGCDSAGITSDAATEASIADHIQNLGDDITVIVVAHRLSTIQHADVVFVVDDGRIVTRGTFAQVRKDVPMIEEYVRLMSFDEDV